MDIITRMRSSQYRVDLRINYRDCRKSFCFRVKFPNSLTTRTSFNLHPVLNGQQEGLINN